MWDTSDIVTIGSSLGLRLSAFIFLRWIPGHHFPPLVLTLFAIYVASIVLYHEYVFTPLRERTSKAALEAQSKHDELLHETTNTELESRALYEEPKTSKIRNVLLSGLPHPRLKPWTYATIAINALLTLFTLDLVFRGPALYSAKTLRFSRTGFVDSTIAKVLFREPDTTQLPIYAYYKAEESSTWIMADKIYYLDEETDYTYPLTFTPLHPATTYEYALSNNLTGNFTTAPTPGTPAATSLTFVTSSCIKANFPYNPLNHALSIPGFKHLSNILTSLPSPANFMLFLGDFIYVDVPLRLSSTASHYRAEYRRVYASPSWSLPLLDSLPWLHTLDDHEIANDWSSGNATPPYPSASDPFRHYHVSVNPPTPPSLPQPPPQNTTYFQFTRGPASFFMLDTRTYRTHPRSANATILGPTQLQSLLRYLATPEPAQIQWKVLSSSVPFTKNWHFGSADTWAGFPLDRAAVLAAMHSAERQLGVRVIILSGDRHEFAAIRYPPPPPPPPPQPQPQPTVLEGRKKKKTTTKRGRASASLSGPHEFSVGPLSMFYLPVRTFWEVDGEDVVVKYVPDGNSKVGVVRLEAVKGERVKGLMRYSLYVDGVLRWEYVLTSPAEEFGGHRQGMIEESLWS